MIDIKALFEKFSNANFFSRVDNIHILELHVGLDEKGRKAIEFRGKFTPRKVSGTSAIEVNQYTRPDYNTIRFSLCDEEVSGQFYKFCEDLVEQTRDVKERSEGYTAIVNRYFQWKKMFVSSKGNLLTEPEIMGLIGEILYLKGTLAERIGLYNALKSWSGQELTHKDFSFDDTNAGIREKWYEAGRKLEKKICVPFVYQCEKSGIGDTQVHEILWYKKRFTLGEDAHASQTPTPKTAATGTPDELFEKSLHEAVDSPSRNGRQPEPRASPRASDGFADTAFLRRADEP